MLERRDFLRLGVAGVLGGLSTTTIAAKPAKLVFVHGRDQQGKDPVLLKAEWLDALKRGAQKINRTLPPDLEIAFPFYGDLLDGFAKAMNIPLSADVQTRGATPNEDFLQFQGELAEEIRTAAGITEAQVDAEYVPIDKPKGPLNWPWVQAILRAVDKHAGGLGEQALETFTRDVFLYTRRSGVRDQVDRLVANSLTEDVSVVVAHSLGTVVAYSVLGTDRRTLNVPLYVTVGSPLGVRAIRDTFRPLKHPRVVKSWFNALDTRDVVSLYPLDKNNFPVNPDITNVDNIKNATSNRHGISGYLDDSGVAKQILDALGT